MAKTLSEHSMRAIGLELDFCLISHLASFSPSPLFVLCFSLSLFKNFLSKKWKVHESPRGALSPAFKNLFRATFSQEKASETGKEGETEVERDWWRKSGYVQHRAMDDSKTEGKMEGWQMEGYKSFGTLRGRERIHNQKYHAHSNWGDTCKVDYKCNTIHAIYITDNSVAQLL